MTMRLGRFRSSCARAVLVSLAAIVWLGGCEESPGELAQGYLRSAQESFGAGELNSAIVELKNALQKDPANTEARALLGKAYFQVGDFAGARKELTNALVGGLDTADLRLYLARAQLALGEFSAALDSLPAEPASESPFLQDLLAARGEALQGMGKYKAAAESFGRAVEVGPHAKAYAGLAQLSFRDRQFDQGFAHLNKALEISPDAAEFHELKGRFSASLRRFGEAEGSYRRALELEPDNTEALIGLANLRIAEKDYVAADELLDQAAQAAPNSIVVGLLKSYVALVRKDYETAHQLSEAILANDERLSTALYISGVSAYALGGYERSINRLNQYLQLVPNDVQAQYALDRAIQERTASSSKAIVADTIIPPHLPISHVAFDAGRRQLDLRRRKALVEVSPDDPRLRAELSIAEALAGDSVQASESLTDALQLESQLDDSPEVARAAVVLAVKQIQERNFQQALETISKVKERFPDRAIGFVLEGIAHSGMQNFGQASNAFAKAHSIEPNSPAVLENMAALEARLGNLEAASDLLRQSLNASPSRYSTLVRLGELSLQMGRRDEGVNWLEKAMAASEDAVAPRIMLGSVFLSQGDYKRVIEVVQPVIEQNPENQSLLTLLGSAQLGLGMADAAVGNFQKLTAIVPDSAEAHYLLAASFAQLESEEAAISELQTALTLDPGHLKANKTLARIYLSNNNLEAAEPLVVALVKDRPTDLEVLTLQADLALQQGNAGLAVDRLNVVHKLSMRSDTLIRLARAQWQAGDRDQSIATLENWIADHPSDFEARLLAGALFAALGRFDEGLVQFKAVAQAQPESWLASNQVAWLLSQTGDYVEALDYAERAFELAPENPIVLDTLGVVLMHRSDLGRSVSLLEKAAAKRPEDNEIAFHYAAALAKSGEIETSKGILERILSDGTPFREKAEAENLLQRLRGK